MKEIKLRPYQQKYIDSARQRFSSGANRLMLVAPTGAG